MSDLRDQTLPPNLLGTDSEIFRLVDECKNKQWIICQIRALIKSGPRLGTKIHSARYYVEGHIVTLEVTLFARRVASGLRLFGRDYIGDHFIIHSGCYMTLDCNPESVYEDHQSELSDVINRFNQLDIGPHWSRTRSRDQWLNVSSVTRTEQLCKARIRWLVAANHMQIFWPGDHDSDDDWSLSDNDP